MKRVSVSYWFRFWYLLVFNAAPIFSHWIFFWYSTLDFVDFTVHTWHFTCMCLKTQLFWTCMQFWWCTPGSSAEPWTNCLNVVLCMSYCTQVVWLVVTFIYLCMCVETWWCPVYKRSTNREHLCKTFRYPSMFLSKQFGSITASSLYIYTVSQKTGHAHYASLLSQMWTNFNNSFTVALSDKLQKKIE